MNPYKHIFSLYISLCFCFSIHGQVLFEENAIDHGFVYVSSENVGISFCDFNGDGWDDITVPSGVNEPVRFFQNIEGTFVEVEMDLVDPIYRTKQVVWVDYDNDGDKDLFVTSEFNSNVLYENNNFVFTDVTESAGLPIENISTNGGAWADYDNDGDLDLFLGNRDSLFENPNMLFMNNGDATFTNVNEASGIGNESTLCFQGTFFDYNNDGWQDIYLINDRTITENILYHNNGDGTFTDVSEVSESNYIMDAMSIAIEDYDSDGDVDVYVTNTFDIDREIKGNVLMKNNGDGTFTDIATETGTRFDDTSWGANWLDGDNNGVLDLYVSGSSDENHETSQSAAFYYNEGDTFTTISENGFEDDLAFSYGNAIGDFNNDGFMDIITLNQAPYNGFLFENKTHELTDNNWLKVRLEGVESNRDGYGATIEIGTTQGTQYRFRASIESYLSQNSDTEVFGLGDATIIDYIQVTWPSGQVDVYNDVDINRTYKIIEGQEVLNITDFNIKDTFRLFPNPVKDIVSLELPITQTNGELHFYDLLGKKVRSQEITVTQTQISLNTLPSGIYIAVYESDTMHISKKIIKL